MSDPLTKDPPEFYRNLYRPEVERLAAPFVQSMDTCLMSWCPNQVILARRIPRWWMLQEEAISFIACWKVAQLWKIE